MERQNSSSIIFLLLAPSMKGARVLQEAEGKSKIVLIDVWGVSLFVSCRGGSRRGARAWRGTTNDVCLHFILIIIQPVSEFSFR